MPTPDNPYTMHGAGVDALQVETAAVVRAASDCETEASALRREVARLSRALTSSNECCNRIQADGNALADRLFQQATVLQRWREVCLEFGIDPNPNGLRRSLDKALDLLGG